MSVDEWNWRQPVELQDVPWDCACASVAWAMQSLGRQVTEAEVVASMYPEYVNENYGLLDASGAGIVAWLSTQGISAENNPYATFEETMAAAGHQPVLMGGRAWCHWTGVRISSDFFPGVTTRQLALANPSPGWMGIEQLINQAQYDQLGEFAVVWLTGW